MESTKLGSISFALQGISSMASNPALGGGSCVTPQELADLTGTLRMLVETVSLVGDEGWENLDLYALSVSSISAAGRAPNPGEWKEIRKFSERADELIRASEVEEAPPPTDLEPPKEPTESPEKA